MFHVTQGWWTTAERPSTRILGPPRPSAVQFWGSALISFIGPLLAVILGIVHAAVAPVVVIGGVKPNFVLVAVVVVTVYGGFGAGVTFAFVAGLTANLLVSDPLGSVPLGLLLVAALVAGGSRLLGRPALLYPPIAAFLGSIVADVVGLLLGSVVGDAVVTRLPSDTILAAATLNAVLAAIVVLPARALAARWATDEAAAW
jgi:rod shape-determining protein MreD